MCLLGVEYASWSGWLIKSSCLQPRAVVLRELARRQEWQVVAVRLTKERAIVHGASQLEQAKYEPLHLQIIFSWITAVK